MRNLLKFMLRNGFGTIMILIGLAIAAGAAHALWSGQISHKQGNFPSTPHVTHSRAGNSDEFYWGVGKLSVAALIFIGSGIFLYKRDS
jgi:hypothetical protein